MKLIERIKKLIFRKSEKSLTFRPDHFARPVKGTRCQGSELFAREFECPYEAEHTIEAQLSPEIIDIAGFNVHQMHICTECYWKLFSKLNTFSVGYSIDFDEIEPAAKKSFTDSANRAMFDKTSSRGRFQK